MLLHFMALTTLELEKFTVEVDKMAPLFDVMLKDHSNKVPNKGAIYLF